MNKKILFLLAALTLMLAGCKSSDEDVLSPEGDRGDRVTITATASGLDKVGRADLSKTLRYQAWIFKLVTEESTTKLGDCVARLKTDDGRFSFNGIPQGEYVMLFFCDYTADGASDTFYDTSKVETETNSNGDKMPLVYMKSQNLRDQYKQGNYSNINNDYYSCWAGKLEFTKTDEDYFNDVKLIRPVYKVTVRNNRIIPSDIPSIIFQSNGAAVDGGYITSFTIIQMSYNLYDATNEYACDGILNCKWNIFGEDAWKNVLGERDDKDMFSYYSFIHSAKRTVHFGFIYEANEDGSELLPVAVNTGVNSVANTHYIVTGNFTSVNNVVVHVTENKDWESVEK